MATTPRWQENNADARTPATRCLLRDWELKGGCRSVWGEQEFLRELRK